VVRQSPDVTGVGIRVLHKLDQQLFRRTTRGVREVSVHNGEFADEVVLLASLRQAAEAAMRKYVNVGQAFGLMVSLQKTKFIMVGHGVTEEDMRPLMLDNSSIELESSPTWGL